MAKVVVIADSTAGIPDDMAKKYDIRRVPAAYIVFEGKTYIEGDSITPAQAYQLFILLLVLGLL